MPKRDARVGIKYLQSTHGSPCSDSPHSGFPQTFLGCNSSHLRVDFKKKDTRSTNAHLSPWCCEGETWQVTLCSDIPQLSRVWWYNFFLVPHSEKVCSFAGQGLFCTRGNQQWCSTKPFRVMAWQCVRNYWVCSGLGGRENFTFLFLAECCCTGFLPFISTSYSYTKQLLQ